jgi:acyl-CoA synthetase (AMP-forming)/AMP-acid ligase II
LSLLSRLEEIARRDPRRAAVTAGDERLTYGELVARIERRAGELQARGVPFLALDGSRPIEFLADFFAARALGRVVLSHPPQLPARLRAMREEAVASALAAGSGGSTSRDAAAIFYSSGSVGPAKAVPLSDASLEAAATALAEWGEVRESDRLAIGLSPAQILGFVRGALNALLFGAEAVFYRPHRDPLAEAERLGADAALLPSALVPLCARHASPVRLRALRCGGGPVAEAAAAAVESARGVPVRAGYGLTETCGLGSRQRGDRPRRPGTSGAIAPGMQVTIVRDDGTACEAGDGMHGEIRLRGPAVFGGYLDAGDPGPFDSEGRLRSGDAGLLDESGELCVRGRLAFALRSGDRILCAEEVEAAIAEHPGVAEAAAAPWDLSFGVLLVLDVRDGSSHSDVLLEEIREHARARLPVFARPGRMVPVPAIPRTASGKVDRRAATEWLSRVP